MIKTILLLRRLPTFFLFFLSLYSLFAQKPEAIHLTEKDGLPDIEFYDMLEDSKGFIWLAADKGLYRYDGKEFKNYTNSQKRGLSVFELFEDKNGRIWCINISGQFFYIENDTLVTFIDLADELQGELTHYLIRGRYLYVFGRKRVYEIDIKTKNCRKIIEHQRPIGIPILNKGEILLQLGDDIVSLSKNNRLVKKWELKKLYNKPILFRPEPSSGVLRFFSTGESLFLMQFINNKNRFFLLDSNTYSFTEFAVPKRIRNKRITKIIKIGNAIWFATSEGAYSYSYKDSVFHFQNSYLEEEFVTKVISDKNDNYWFTTLQNGVYVIPNINVGRHPISQQLENISCLEKIDENTLIFGTTDGMLGIYDIYNQETKTFNLSGGSRVSSLLYNPDKERVYVSADDDSYIILLETLEVISQKTFKSAKSMSLLDEDRLLYTSYSGAVIKSGIEEAKDFNNIILSQKRGYYGYYSSFSENSYVSYIDNLVRYDASFSPKNITFNGNPIFVMSMAETDNEILWVSTFKEGIFGIKNDSVVVNYTKKNGLVSNQVSILQSDNDNLWIVTDKGIQLFNSKSKTFKTLTKRDGIPSYRVTGIVPFKEEVVFSSNVGLFSVEKAKVFKTRPIPEVYFTNVKIAERDTLVKEQYKLPYDENRIRFDFRANSFQTKENVVYQYRLLGGSSIWTTLDSGIDYVQFNNLANGNYTFQVRAQDAFNNKTSQIKKIVFSIATPFWEHWWFITTVILIISMSMFFYFRKKVQRREKERIIEVDQLQLDNQLTELKLENLRSQMNPHFIFNALNSIQEYIVLNQKELASDYLGKFADLVRTYLRHSGKGIITLQEEISCLEMYLELEKLRFEDKLTYAITKADDVFADEINIPTMLIQPYVENALKHGLLHKKTDSILKVSFCYSEDRKSIICKIQDNGIGRQKAQELKERSKKLYESFATKANDDRLNLINYGKQNKIGVSITDLYDTNTQAIGTLVVVTVPYKKE